MSKKWLNATFSSFYLFRISHLLPGGETRKARKPPGFIRSDAHVVRAGLNIRGFGPMVNHFYISYQSALRLSYHVDAHVLPERFGNGYGAVGVLVVFKNCCNRASDSQSGAVEGMNELGL